MSLNLQLPEKGVLRPRITVFGVGGAGGKAVNNMISANLEGVEFVVANTDAQALEHAFADKKIQLGEKTTKGLGAGASPDVGSRAAEEALEEVKEHLKDANMAFITAGMGGGTGTGAAPVIAQAAKEMDILTVGVVTKPFHFEGGRRMKIAEEGLTELQQYVDTLIVIPNQNLFRIANENTTFADAFKMADDVLHSGIRSVTDLMIMPGLINLDFADVKAVMLEMGTAMMGTGEAEGERRAIEAAEAAISNPLLDNTSMRGAQGVLISITGGSDLTLFEVDEAANRIREEVDPEANIIFGSTFNENLEGKIRVSVVATGIDSDKFAESLHVSASRAKKEAIAPVVEAASQVKAETVQELTAEGASAREGNTQKEVKRENPGQEDALASMVALDQIKEELQKKLGEEAADKVYQDTLQKLNEEYSTAQKADEQEDAQEQRVFVASTAIEPEEFEKDALSQQPSYEEHDDSNGENGADAEERKSGGSFFSRMAKVARSLQGERKEKGAQEELVMADESVSYGESGTASEKKPAQEDLLDIPAFLRRK